MTFLELVSRHLGLSLRKQLALIDFLGEHPWHLTVDRGIVDFGPGRVYPVQILGSEAEEAGTWLWAWANQQIDIPPPVLEAANRLRALGQQDGIPELTEALLPSDRYPGHLLACVASGVCGADAYYRGPYDGGAVFFLIGGLPMAEAPTPVPRLCTVLMQAISQFELPDHRLFVESYLSAEGFTLTREPAKVTAADPSGRQLSVAFDELGRISGVRAGVAG